MVRRPPVRARAILETVLYAPDVAAAEAFYTGVFGLTVALHMGSRGVALHCGDGVLLVFDPAATRADDQEVPSHGAEGPGHVAFTATADELPAWRAHLAARAVPVEREVTWPGGGTSLYLRDPAGNSVELAPPGLWV